MRSNNFLKNLIICLIQLYCVLLLVSAFAVAFSSLFKAVISLVHLFVISPSIPDGKAADKLLFTKQVAIQTLIALAIAIPFSLIALKVAPVIHRRLSPKKIKSSPCHLCQYYACSQILICAVNPSYDRKAPCPYFEPICSSVRG